MPNSFVHSASDPNQSRLPDKIVPTLPPHLGQRLKVGRFNVRNEVQAIPYAVIVRDSPWSRLGNQERRINRTTFEVSKRAELEWGSEARRIALNASVGDGHITAKMAAARIVELFETSEDEDRLPATLPTHRERNVGRAKRRRGQTTAAAGVVVEGVDDMMVRLAKCCTPVPPDEVMGFVTRGRGVSVHRSDCANAVSLAAGHANRLIDVEWDDDSDGTFVAAIEVRAFDRTRLLGDVSTVLSDARVNILTSSTRTGADRISTMNFEFELGDGRHLDWLLSLIRRVDGVYDAYRVVPGRGG